MTVLYRAVDVIECDHPSCRARSHASSPTPVDPPAVEDRWFRLEGPGRPHYKAKWFCTPDCLRDWCEGEWMHLRKPA